MATLLGLLISAAFAATAAADSDRGHGHHSERNASVSVTGRASMTLQPTLATVEYAVISAAASAAAALDANGRDVDAVLAGLTAIPGVSLDSIALLDFSLQQTFNSTTGAAIGFEAQRRSRVTLGDLALVSSAVASIVAGGGNRVNDIVFDVSDGARLQASDSVLATATFNSLSAAQAVAFGLGLEAGRAVSVAETSSSGSGASSPLFARLASLNAGSPESFAPGQLKISASVAATFELTQARAQPTPVPSPEPSPTPSAEPAPAPTASATAA